MRTGIKLKPSLLAPCGMNCGLCLGYQRDINRCNGCVTADPGRPGYCIRCTIKNCKNLKAKNARFCFTCGSYPCRRLKKLDKRYQTKYRAHMLENLSIIKEKGIREFLRLEKEKWKCPNCGNFLCVHRTNCLYCGKAFP